MSVRLIGEDGARLLRRYVRAEVGEERRGIAGALGLLGYVWAAPRIDRIDIVPASGRARCRACGETIEKGATAILFGLGVGRPGSPVTDAYLHSDECPAASAPPSIVIDEP